MILYSKGYKYQLEQDYEHRTGIYTRDGIKTDYYELKNDGLLVINKGYAWDGPSGGVDTANFMRASLVHDVLCQAIGDGLLPQTHQKAVDTLLREIAIEDGMWKMRAWWVYNAVRFHFRGGRKPDGREILQAP